MTTKKTALAVAVVALAMIAAACGGRDDDSSGSDTTAANGDNGEQTTLLADPDLCDSYNGSQGVTDDTILIGNTLPQSGTFSVFDKVRVGIEAYFTYQNNNGGVKDRQLELKSLDDQYLPEESVANVETLVNNDGVFALLGNVGTENNEQIQQSLEGAGQCVPNLAVATGYPGFGEPDSDPWVINGLPNYALESIAFVEYLKENSPEATVAILSQNDSFGQSYVDAFEAAIEGTDITVVAEETFDPKTETNPQGQVTTLAASGADALLLGVTSIPCPNALNAVASSTWDPLIYVTLTCSSKVLMSLAGEAAEGTISTRATYDPADPDSQSVAAVQEFKTEGAAAGLSAEDLDDLNVAAGWNFGAYLVQLLEASPELDRAEVMNTAWFQDGVTFGMNLDGLEWTTDGATDPYGINQLQFIVRTDGNWVPQGELVDYTSQLEDYIGG